MSDRAPNQHRLVHLATFLRDSRLRLGKTQAQVAAESLDLPDPVSSSLISKLEACATSVKAPHLLTLAHLYGVPAAVLLEKIELDRAAILAPSDSEAPELVRRAGEELRAGNAHRAYVLLVSALCSLVAVDGQSPDSRLRVQALIRAGVAARRLGKPLTAERHLREALGVRPLSAEEKAYSCHNLALSLRDTGAVVMAEAMARSAAEAADAAGLRRLHLNAKGLHGGLSLDQGDAVGAARIFAALIPHLVELGEAADVAQYRSSLAVCRVRLGRHEDGLRLHRRAITDAKLLGNDWLVCETRKHFAESLLHCGRSSDAAREFGRLAVLAGRGRLSLHAFLANYYLWRIAESTNENREAERLFGVLEALRGDVQGDEVEIAAFDQAYLARKRETE